jgi:hypothetical protein
MSICSRSKIEPIFEDDELADFRKLVKAYATLTTHQVDQLIRENHWMEICDGDQA